MTVKNKNKTTETQFKFIETCPVCALFGDLGNLRQVVQSVGVGHVIQRPWFQAACHWGWLRRHRLGRDAGGCPQMLAGVCGSNVVRESFGRCVGPCRSQ